MCEYEKINKFIYLGSIVRKDGNSMEEIWRKALPVLALPASKILALMLASKICHIERLSYKQAHQTESCWFIAFMVQKLGQLK